MRQFKLSKSKTMFHTLQLKRKKKYTLEDYEVLFKPYLGKYEILRYCDYVREPEIGDRKVLLVRHDVDHDHITAQKIAKWEYNHDIRATYCLLHTAWYYGKLDGESYVHTRDLLDCAKLLFDLGHEVNFHNNLVALALRKGIDPVELLKRELEFFRSNGVGTSTHGDSLCRELNVRNWELFKECCDEGTKRPPTWGPRTLEYNGNTVELGKHSMKSFGLEYEAYDIARDVYHTDSGGNMRTRHRTRGRRPFGRHDPEKGAVVGILAHPVWWNFD